MTYTENLELPLFESGDAIDLISVYNAAMAILDDAVSGAASTASAASSAATALETKLAKTATGLTVADLADSVVTSGGYVATPDPVQNNN